MSSLSGGGGPTLRTVVKADAMADSKGKCGRADMVAVVTAATCLVNSGSSCQKGCEEVIGLFPEGGVGGAGGVGAEDRPALRLRWWPWREEGLVLRDSTAASARTLPSARICLPNKLNLSNSDSRKSLLFCSYIPERRAETAFASANLARRVLTSLLSDTSERSLASSASRTESSFFKLSMRVSRTARSASFGLIGVSESGCEVGTGGLDRAAIRAS